MNGGDSAAKSSSAQVVELGQEEASTSETDASEKSPEIVVIAVDGSKQAETAFKCMFVCFLLLLESHGLEFVSVKAVTVRSNNNALALLKRPVSLVHVE